MKSETKSEWEGYGDLDDYDLKLQRRDLNNLALPLQKYIAGQRILTAIIGHENSPLAVTLPPQKLYKKLSKHKMTWDSKRKMWRPWKRGKSK